LTAPERTGTITVLSAIRGPAKQMKPWYANGLRFECTGCGGCCRARNGYDHVYLDLGEARALARHLGLSLRAFKRRYTRVLPGDGQLELAFVAGACPFLAGTSCTVYAARPLQCRTWPFWPENLRQRTWQTEIAPSTPGVGRGRLYTQAEIDTIAGSMPEL
jgi:Fe-S-cluster containining protein